MICAGGILLLGAGALTDKANETGEADTGANPHITVAFEIGVFALSKPDKDKIRGLLREARAKAKSKGSIERVLVAAWSDKKFPREGQSLQREDRELAENRASVISNFLRYELEVDNIDSHNMAEPPSWLARTLKSSDEKLKSNFERHAATFPLAKDAFQIVREVGGAGRAVIVVEEVGQHD
ncbi:MAG: hypothetical protein ACXVB9_17800 [Bdellovibrionota bacterium]